MADGLCACVQEERELCVCVRERGLYENRKGEGEGSKKKQMV